LINGVMAAPVMALMLLASNRMVMGRFTLSLPLRLVGWAATAVMGLSVAALPPPP
jgi:hypothetical protein